MLRRLPSRQTNSAVHRTIIAILLISLASCSTGTIPSPVNDPLNATSPQGGNAAPLEAAASSRASRNRVPALVSNGGTLRSFSDAVNLPLKTDADYERFIDPQIIGADRLQAIFFMRSMPPNMRGDFVYVSHTGKILSNRLAVAASVTFLPHMQTAAPPIPSWRAPIATAIPVKYATAQNVCSGGACIRTYSVSGLNAIYGYAVPPCDMAFGSNESGNMYFNAYDSNGYDVVDAGLGTNINGATQYSPGNPQPPSVSFVNPGGGYNNTGWTNQSQTYPCGQPVGLMYGTMPSPNQGYSLLITGVPAFDPTSVNTPPSTTTWSPGAWDFWDTPSALLQSPGQWNGVNSNCSNCSVAAMLTIAQNGGLNYDGACYGYCTSSGADAFWYETVAGQLVPTCNTPPQQSSETCTIEYTTSWQSNDYTNLQTGFAYSSGTQQQIAEGINLNNLQNTQSATRKFSSLPTVDAPPCTPDSKSYCVIEMSASDIGSCEAGVGPTGKPFYLTLTEKTYDVFQKGRMLELRLTTTETEHHSGGAKCGTISYTWSPSEPRVTFNDSNLP